MLFPYFFLNSLISPSSIDSIYCTLKSYSLYSSCWCETYYRTFQFWLRWLIPCTILILLHIANNNSLYTTVSLSLFEISTAVTKDLVIFFFFFFFFLVVVFLLILIKITSGLFICRRRFYCLIWIIAFWLWFPIKPF